MGGGSMLMQQQQQQQIQNKFFLEQLQQHQQKQMLMKQHAAGGAPLFFPTSSPKVETVDATPSDGSATAAPASKTEGEQQGLGTSLGFGGNATVAASGTGAASMPQMPQVRSAWFTIFIREKFSANHLCMSAWGGLWAAQNLQPCCTAR
jgi:hypothetical protein